MPEFHEGSEADRRVDHAAAKAAEVAEGRGASQTSPSPTVQTLARSRSLAGGRSRVSGALSAGDVLALQRSIGNAGTSAALQREEEPRGGRSPVHEVIGGGGAPLDSSTRSTMESQLGGNFGDVRLHVDARSAESVQAAAFTVGNDIVVHPDHYAAGTPQAQRTLAHELTHVKQQAAGPVAGTPRQGGVSVSDPSDRFEQEAERSAESVMAGVQRQSGAPGEHATSGASSHSLVEDDDRD